MSSCDEDAGTLPQEERTTPRRSQRTRNRIVHTPSSLSPNSDDDDVVPSSQPAAQSFDDSDEVPSSLPPVLPPYTDVLEGEQPRDKEQSSSSSEEEYANVEVCSSDEDDVPLAHIKKNNQATKKTSSKTSKKKSSDSVRLFVAYSVLLTRVDVLYILSLMMPFRGHEVSDTLLKRS